MNKATQKTMFSSKTDDWATPQWLFDELNAKYGPFGLDVCASKENAKCHCYYTEIDDGLRKNWAIDIQHGSCWMNPPYGREIGKWVKKAYEESQKGCLVVALLPARTDTRWFHQYIYRQPNVNVDFCRGRLKFGTSKNSAPFPSMIVVFNPPKEKE